MAVSLKKAGSLPYSFMKFYLRDSVSFRGVLINSFSTCNDSKKEKEGNNSSEEKTHSTNSEEKTEKITNEEIFSASLRVVRVRGPKAPSPGEGSGGKIH